MTAATPTTEPLSLLLRSGTRDDHHAAESMTFIDRLLAGSLSTGAYIDLAAQLVHIYRALEETGDALTDDPIGSTIVFEGLRRVPALEHDLTIMSPGWQQDPGTTAPLPVTAAYAARIRSGGLTGYVAHAYTRYLGDLSGGQVIARMVHRHYGVPDEALSFYRFDALGKIKPFKDVYRARLDALPFTADQRDAVVAESREAFRANRELFAALGTAHIG